MQSDSHESDPRLQRVNPGSKITTGFVDPCLVYLETTLPGETPFLIALRAESTHEILHADGTTHLELNNLVLFKWASFKVFWLPTPYEAANAVLHSHGTAFSIEISSFKPFPGNSNRNILPISSGKILFTGSIQYLDQTTYISLGNPNPLDVRSQLVFARKLLENAQVDWQSISDALTGLKRMETSRNRMRKPLLRRLISSLFKKKSKPIAV